MPFQFENRYTMDKEMLREYIRKIVCRGLSKSCLFLSGFCFLLCVLSIQFHRLGIAVVLCSFAAMGVSANDKMTENAEEKM